MIRRGESSTPGARMLPTEIVGVAAAGGGGGLAHVVCEEVVLEALPGCESADVNSGDPPRDHLQHGSPSSAPFETPSPSESYCIVVVSVGVTEGAGINIWGRKEMMTGPTQNGCIMRDGCKDTCM